MNSSKETNKQQIHHIEKMYDSKKKKKTHLQSITYFPLIKYIYVFHQRAVKIDRKV